MNDVADESLEGRIGKLEAAVESLRVEVAGLRERPPSRPTVKDTGPKRERKPASRRSASSDAFESVVRRVFRTEALISRIGIALLVFGVIFVFKWGIDHGWITESVRVAFGGVLGAFLATVGLRLTARRPALGQLLLGGAAATFYVTLFAAYQMYALLPYAVALALMIAVTVATFGLSVRFDALSLGLIALLGGMATPFLLYGDQGSLIGLVAYICAIIAGSVAIYWYKGWPALAWGVAIMGWAELGFATEQLDRAGAVLTTQVVMQAGLLFGWILLGLVPLARALSVRNVPDVDPADARKLWSVPVVRRPELALSLAAPILTVLMSRFWGLGSAGWGAIELSLGFAYAVAYITLERRGEGALGAAVGLAAVALGAISLLSFFESGPARLAAVCAEALLVMTWARGASRFTLRVAGHALFFLCGIDVFDRVLREGVLPPLVNGESLAILAVIAMIFVASFLLALRSHKDLYRLAALLAVLLWFLRDLSALENGQALVSLAWGVTAIVLIVAAVRLRSDGVRRVGVATLLIVVVKLFMVDLAALDAVWRIILFLSLGALLLLLSYLFPALFRGQVAAAAPRAEPLANDRTPKDA
jgi:uncharacterized membrane protein